MNDIRHLNRIDQCLAWLGAGLATVAGVAPAARPSPASVVPDTALDPAQRRLSAALMRVNHVGEVCAQALYDGQAASTQDAALSAEFRRAAAQESDHLAWTRERIAELGGRESLLNPVWYAGAFALGLLAGRAGDRASLGFMAETERQVERHLEGHLQRLPIEDARSRAVVSQMMADEAAHAQTAERLGGVELPLPIRGGMRLAARVMTTTAHYL